MIRFLTLWLPVLIWMVLIFSSSTDAGSTVHTSRFVEPFLHWLFPSLSTDAIAEIHLLIRKTAHMCEYGFMALLCWRAVSGQRPPQAQPWNWKTAAIAWQICVAYAAGDEFHQLFVPSRGASIFDVMIDACGALVGLSLVWVFQVWRGRIARPKKRAEEGS